MCTGDTEQNKRVTLILFLVHFCYVTNRRRNNDLLVSLLCSSTIHKDSWKNGLEQQEISGLTFFDMNTIRAATNNFNVSNKLGQGGFGPVYKVIR